MLSVKALGFACERVLFTWLLMQRNQYSKSFNRDLSIIPSWFIDLKNDLAIFKTQPDIKTLYLINHTADFSLTEKTVYFYRSRSFIKIDKHISSRH